MTAFQKSLTEIIKHLLSRSNEWPPAKTAGGCKSISFEVGAAYGLGTWEWEALGKGCANKFPLRVSSTISECTSPHQLAKQLSRALIDQDEWAQERAF